MSTFLRNHTFYHLNSHHGHDDSQSFEPFFRYSVSFPTDDDNVDHLTVDDENYDVDMTGQSLIPSTTIVQTTHIRCQTKY
jgi:hypothetical protein